MTWSWFHNCEFNQLFNSSSVIFQLAYLALIHPDQCAPSPHPSPNNLRASSLSRVTAICGVVQGRSDVEVNSFANCLRWACTSHSSVEASEQRGMVGSELGKRYQMDCPGFLFPGRAILIPIFPRHPRSFGLLRRVSMCPSLPESYAMRSIASQRLSVSK